MVSCEVMDMEGGKGFDLLANVQFTAGRIQSAAKRGGHCTKVAQALGHEVPCSELKHKPVKIQG